MKPEKQETESEYIGNIWGWKFSFISLGIILFFTGLALYRSHVTGGGWQKENPPAEAPVQDTLPNTVEQSQ